MRDDPSVPLPAEWRFAPGRVAWPFISSVCKAETHDIATKYFHRLFDNYTRHGDPVMESTIHMLPRFRARFFEQSRALMAGFKTLTFSHGLDYAITASTYPEHVSLWHFVPSLDDLPDGRLTPLGLSPHQLAQMLTNYRSCLAQIFANGRDYHSIPPIHKSPVTWCSTFYCALVHATRLLMAPEVIAAWEVHRRNNPGHGLRLTTGFIHHIGLLLRLFDDWLDVAEQDMQYCQAFIAFDSTDTLGRRSKTGYVLAVSTSAQTTFEAQFSSWDTDLKRMFSPQSIHSSGYRYDEAFGLEPPSFLVQRPPPIHTEPKRAITTTSPAPDAKRRARGGNQVSFQPSMNNPRAPARLPSPPSILHPPGGPPQPARDRRSETSAPILNGKSSATIALLKWRGITQGNGNLQEALTTWRTAGPPGTTRFTPKIAGKWLCFKFCTEGLFCTPPPGITCYFTHVDLAQPHTWNNTTLRPILDFLALPDSTTLGLSLTPAGVQASATHQITV